MISALNRFWNFISYLGVNDEIVSDFNNKKRQVFFNRSLFIGSFALLGTIGSSIPFIGNYAYLNLVSWTGVILGLIIHAKGNYGIAKRVAIYPLALMGIILTAISGGDFLYHTGVITVLVFCWLIFDRKKELPELLLFLLITIYAYVVGEYNLFDAPDFTQHPDTQTARIVNLIMYTSVTIIFINFMRNVNRSYEERLSTIISEKEVLFNEVLEKSKELENERKVLEDIISDRTEELREQKDVLLEQNKEKEILLKEIHHRVKNNLQIIVSLLNLQASEIEDEEVLRAIEETQNRIISMSLVHQRMYQTSNFVAIQMHDYIDLLIENNNSIYSQSTHGVNYNNTTPNELRISIDKAIPLGLIINEMIANSFKYAFSETSTSNNVSLKLEELSESKLSLKYKDNGPGLPEDFVIEESETLGIQLIAALVEQIDGELTYYNDEGAVFEIIFNN